MVQDITREDLPAFYEKATEMLVEATIHHLHGVRIKRTVISKRTIISKAGLPRVIDCDSKAVLVYMAAILHVGWNDGLNDGSCLEVLRNAQFNFLDRGIPLDIDSLPRETPNSYGLKFTCFEETFVVSFGLVN